MSTDASPKLSSMKYLVSGILHADEQGTVMLIGDQGALGRNYALKIIPRNGPESDVHLDVARAAAEASPQLGHPAILKYFDYRTRKSFFRVSRAELLMEFVQGQPLPDLQKVGVTQWALIFSTVAAAVAHMHRRKVIHGDLSPAHILLSRSGDVKVMGYGRGAVTLKNPADAKAIVPGSRAYMAPERLREKKVDEKCDIYSLGASMYHMMTGQPANVGKRSMGEAGKISTPIAINPKITSDLNNIIVNCLHSAPERRPDSMYDVSQLLEQAVARLKPGAEILRGIAQVPQTS